VAQRHAEWQAGGQDKGRSCLDFLQQMGYREYSRYLSFHFPFITERSMLAHLRAVPWRLDQAAYKAWRQGLTGYPLVDAGGWVVCVGAGGRDVGGGGGGREEQRRDQGVVGRG
jgi:deoxyribodipyrimidine photolyase